MAESQITKDVTQTITGLFTNINTDRLTEILVAVILCLIGFFNRTIYFKHIYSHHWFAL